MSATNNPTNPAAPTPTPAPYYPTTQDNYTWGQISAGPQAIAFPAIMQLMQIMNNLMDMYNKQAQLQLTVQANAAKAAASATIDAANQQANQSFMEAGNSFAGAVVGTVGIIGTTLASKPLNQTLTDEGNNKAGLDKLQTQLTNSKIAGTGDASAGTPPTTTPPIRSTDPLTLNDENRTKVEARIQQLCNGGDPMLTAAKDPDMIKGRNANGIVVKKTITEEAIAQIMQRGEQAKQFSEKLTSNQDTNSKRINDATTKLQTLQQQSQTYQGIVTGVVGGAFKAREGYYQTLAGQAQGASGLDTNNAQQAATMASNSQGLISKFYDEEMQAISMLQQIAASATVHA